MPRFRGGLRPIRFMLGAHSAYYIIFKTENQKSLILQGNKITGKIIIKIRNKFWSQPKRKERL